MFVQVMRTGDESAIDISNKVEEYIKGSPNRFPEGIFLYTWDDKSLSMRGRLGNSDQFLTPRMHFGVYSSQLISSP